MIIVKLLFKHRQIQDCCSEVGGEGWEVAGAGGDVARGVVERDEDGGM